MGVSVAGSGDLNDDGFARTWQLRATGSTRRALFWFFICHIWITRCGQGGQLSAANLDGSNGFEIRGSSVNDQLGISAQFIGDINADGLDDLAVGANQAEIANGPGSGCCLRFVRRRRCWFERCCRCRSLDGVLGLCLRRGGRRRSRLERCRRRLQCGWNGRSPCWQCTRPGYGGRLFDLGEDQKSERTAS